MQTTLLRQIWQNSSYVTEIKDHSGFKGWLAKEDFYIDSYKDEKEFALFVRDKDHFKKAISYDAFRFTVNSLQSIAEIRPNPSYGKISAWCIIKAYYASFFSAHALLRLFGRPFVHLDTGHVNIIRDHLKNETNKHSKINSGNYALNFDANHGKLKFSHVKDSHKDLWNEFLVLCRYLSTEVLNIKAPSEDLANLQNYFDDLGKILTKNGTIESGNWLSTFRNDVNYKSYNAAWYPFTKNDINFEEFLRKMQQWRKTPLTPSLALQNKSELEWSLHLSVIIIQTTFRIIDDYKSILRKKTGIPDILERFYNHTAPHSLI